MQRAHGAGKAVRVAADRSVRHQKGYGPARLAMLAWESGCDGLVCSAADLPALRRVVGPGPLVVTPGTRPADGSLDDQKRVATPRQAAAAGADFLVIGRPITQAPDPLAAAGTLALLVGGFQIAAGAASLAGLVDFAAERARLTKELENVDKQIARIDGQLGNAGFVAKAPANIIERETAKRGELIDQRVQLVERLGSLEE